MKKVLSIVALMAFMVSSASVVNFKEKEKEKKKRKLKNLVVQIKKQLKKNHVLQLKKNHVVLKNNMFYIS